jgi:hypothetical protein
MYEYVDKINNIVENKNMKENGNNLINPSKLYIGFNLFPVFIINIIILLFIIIRRDFYGINTYFNIFVNPVYLFIINMIHSIKYKKYIFIKNIIFMIFSSIIGIIFSYIHLMTALRKIIKLTKYEDGIFIEFLISIVLVVLIIGIIEQIILLILHKMKWEKYEKKQNCV